MQIPTHSERFTAPIGVSLIIIIIIKNFYSDICCAAKPRCFRATVTIGDKRLIENGAS